MYWQLAELGVQCEVVAPTLVPVKAGDRVKTDRRDAEKLARSYRSGDLTAVWVPDEGSEALRDLVRAREAASRISCERVTGSASFYCARVSVRPRSETWTHLYLIWVSQIRFMQMAQEATRLDYLHEVEHMRERVARLEQAIAEAVKLASLFARPTFTPIAVEPVRIQLFKQLILCASMFERCDLPTAKQGSLCRWAFSHIPGEALTPYLRRKQESTPRLSLRSSPLKACCSRGDQHPPLRRL